jgi:hypothetical protein
MAGTGLVSEDLTQRLVAALRFWESQDGGAAVVWRRFQQGAGMPAVT